MLRAINGVPFCGRNDGMDKLAINRKQTREDQSSLWTIDFFCGNVSGWTEISTVRTHVIGKGDTECHAVSDDRTR